MRLNNWTFLMLSLLILIPFCESNIDFTIRGSITQGNITSLIQPIAKTNQTIYQGWLYETRPDQFPEEIITGTSEDGTQEFLLNYKDKPRLNETSITEFIKSFTIEIPFLFIIFFLLLLLILIFLIFFFFYKRRKKKEKKKEAYITYSG